MEIKKFLFLLDENVDANLLKLLKSDGFDVTTVQREGWGGYRNGQLSKLIQGKDIIFLTRDRDFQFLWEKYSLKVIYFLIEPSYAENIWKELKQLLHNWNIPLTTHFLIRLQVGSIRISRP